MLTQEILHFLCGDDILITRRLFALPVLTVWILRYIASFYLYGGDDMPKVNGKKYAYTKKGMAKAKTQAKKKIIKKKTTKKKY